ncbi:MAG: DUF4255 domain-containing protein [Cyanobacteria bacterium J06634_6]
MSNHLAIATVTAALKQVLQAKVSQDVPGAQVTTIRPETPGGNVAGACINLFLYHAAPNTAWRNADLRTRRPKGDLVKHGQASLDLHYLLTFYGNEQRLEPQRLMGSAVQTLIDNPQLDQSMIRTAMRDDSELQDSTLDEQTQLVRFFPSDLTTEELTRIWSIFFQIPYSLSFAYQGTAVTIQGRRPGKSPLPVRSRRFYLSSTRPAIDRVSTTGGFSEPITLGSRLVIQGRELKKGFVQVQIGEARINPQIVNENTIEVAFSDLLEEQRNTLRAGAQGLKVIQLSSPSTRSTDCTATSNLLSIVLCPTILHGQAPIEPSALRELEDEQYMATVTLRVDIPVGIQQSTFLLLNRVDDPQDTHIIRRSLRIQPNTQTDTQAEESTQTLIFEVSGISAGRYLTRVQVDGAESPLEVDETDLHVGPLLLIEGAT